MRTAAFLLVVSASLPAQSDTATTQRSLLEYDRALAVRIADGSDVGLLALADSNAAILIPGQPILRAVDAARIFRDRYYGKYDWRPVAVVVSADGQFGCTTGFSNFYELTDKTKPATRRRGSYVACWRKVPGAGSRERGANWKLVALERADAPREAPAYWTAKQLPAGVGPASAGSLPIYSSGPEALAGAVSADSAFAREAEKPEGPGPAFAHWAADDGWLIGTTKPTVGKSQILAAFDGYPPDRALLWDPAREFGYASAGLAFTVGNARTMVRDTFGMNGPATNSQKYLTVWRQNADRTWSWIVDLGTPRP